MTTAGKTNACLIVWTNISAEEEAAFNDWYTREHLRSRALLPKFKVSRRFRADVGGPRYLAHYEVRDAAAFRSDEYLQLVATPDPLSAHFIPRFQGTIRIVAKMLADAGSDYGGTVGVWAFDVSAGAEGDIRNWLSTTATADLISHTGIVRATAYEKDAGLLGASVRVHKRSGDKAPQFLLIAEAALPEYVDAVRRDVLSEELLSQKGAFPVSFARMQLMSHIDNSAA
jgi:hypothetical protein